MVHFIARWIIIRWILISENPPKKFLALGNDSGSAEEIVLRDRARLLEAFSCDGARRLVRGKSPVLYALYDGAKLAQRVSFMIRAPESCLRQTSGFTIKNEMTIRFKRADVEIFGRSPAGKKQI
jgi:hypothetical protein